MNGGADMAEACSDEDPETHQDYEDFKAWLDKNSPAHPAGEDVRKDEPEAKAPKSREVVPRDQVNWICNLCKKDTKACH